jgi:hypothetical protein
MRQSPDDDPQRTDIRLVFTCTSLYIRERVISNGDDVYGHDPPLFLSAIERSSPAES